MDQFTIDSYTLKNLITGVSAFTADMRAKGIHVGMGRDPHCVTCGETWPCPSSKDSRLDDDQG
jgi:hypothetical protein